MTARELRAALERRATDAGLAWLDDGIERVRREPEAVHVLFPAVRRNVGRGPLDPDHDPADVHAWTVDDAARTLLLLALGGGDAGATLEELYRNGDAAERRAVLRSLALVPSGDAGVRLVDDAVRTNETALIAAALGPYAFERLDDAAVAQAVLKCVFVGIPLAGLDGLDARVTPELSRMLAAFVHERIAAGRSVPADVWPPIDRFPPADELDAIRAELDHPLPERRDAARAALALRRQPLEA
jgi:hypothetical protein